MITNIIPNSTLVFFLFLHFSSCNVWKMNNLISTSPSFLFLFVVLFLVFNVYVILNNMIKIPLFIPTPSDSRERWFKTTWLILKADSAPLPLHFTLLYPSPLFLSLPIPILKTTIHWSQSSATEVSSEGN